MPIHYIVVIYEMKFNINFADYIGYVTGRIF